MRSLGYFFKESLHGFTRNLSTTLGSIVTIFLSLLIIGISACCAGAVCGDHCSPISDTTIMASAGAQCEHVNHVSTQLPYAITAAAVSCVSYIVAGYVRNVVISLIVAIALMLATLAVIKMTAAKGRKI